MDQYTSEDARREWRHILDKIQRDEPVEITRYGERLAVVVPAEWFDQAKALIEIEEGDQLSGQEP